MSLAHPIVEYILLGMLVLACWLGVAGMLRMRYPTQALHFLALPAAGSVLLTAAVFLQTGSSQAAWKSLFITLMLLGVNSVVAHASARAFRTRQLGHWEPRDGDPMEFVRDSATRTERRRG